MLTTHTFSYVLLLYSQAMGGYEILLKNGTEVRWKSSDLRSFPYNEKFKLTLASLLADLFFVAL